MIFASGIELDDRATASDGRTERSHRHPSATLDGSRARGRRMPALLPLERLRATTDTVLQAIAGEGKLVVVLPRHVLQTELQRIDLQLICDLIHQRLDAEDALRIGGPAQVRRYGHVGVDRINGGLDVGALIQ